MLAVGHTGKFQLKDTHLQTTTKKLCISQSSKSHGAENRLEETFHIYEI